MSSLTHMCINIYTYNIQEYINLYTHIRTYIPVRKLPNPPVLSSNWVTAKLPPTIIFAPAPV